MKIVATSNYSLDNYSEWVIASNLNEYMGKYIVELMIKDMHEGEDMFPVLKPDDYVPFVWEP